MITLEVSFLSITKSFKLVLLRFLIKKCLRELYSLTSLSLKIRDNDITFFRVSKSYCKIRASWAESNDLSIIVIHGLFGHEFRPQ